MTNYVTVNGNTYNDGNVGPNNMGQGGFRTYLFPMFSDTIVQLNSGISSCATSAAAAAASATAAAASATSAVNAPGTNATSATSMTIGTGNQTFTIQTSKNFVVGAQVIIAQTASPTNWMAGTVTAYNSSTGAMTVNVANTSGSGTVSAWTVSLTGIPSTAGGTGSFTNVTISGTLSVTGTTTLAYGSSAPGLLEAGGQYNAAGTNQATAQILTDDINIISPVTTTGMGVITPTAAVGKTISVCNRGSNSIYVYPASNEYLDTNGLNVPITLPPLGYLVLQCFSTSQWTTSINTIINASCIQGNVATANSLNTANSYTGGAFNASGQAVGISNVYGSGSSWFKSVFGTDGTYGYLAGTSAQTSQSSANAATINSLKPFYWNMSTGAVGIDGTGVGTTFGGNVNILGNGSFETLSCTGNLSCTGISSLEGITTGANPAAGTIGEPQSVNGASTAMTASSQIGLASLTLQPGIWDISGNVFFLTGSGTVTNATTQASIGTSVGGSLSPAWMSSGPISSANTLIGYSLGTFRVNITSATTYHAWGEFIGTLGTSPTAYATILATRRS